MVDMDCEPQGPMNPTVFRPSGSLQPKRVELTKCLGNARTRNSELPFDLGVPNRHISLGFQGGREGGRTTFTKWKGARFRE